MYYRVVKHQWRTPSLRQVLHLMRLVNVRLPWCTHSLSCHISQPMCQCRVTEPKVHCSSSLDFQSDLIVEDGLLEVSHSGRSGLTITNTSDHTCRVRRGTVMGSTCQATVEVIPGDGYQASATRRLHTEEVGTRRQLLADLLKGQDMALDNTISCNWRMNAECF